ncbi:response regulator transcription factor [Usitatibacter palustris]|uniref:response regulator transcription factor n=1 Tax=Usitatibacter palustris TaxID=2732487 RepID=UPI001BB1E984|nr:response regulator [Usitatibacter palustris]
MTEQVVHVVDDDESTRELMAWLMRKEAIPCRTHGDPRAFLAAVGPTSSGCLVLDLHMPGMTGLDIQRTLKERGVDLPIIFLSGRADVPRAVEAVKSGAIDFVEKPFDYKRIVALIRECLKRDAKASTDRQRRHVVAARIAQLTQREHEVLERVVAGQLNRVIAEGLDISIKTVEAHRAHIMEKLEVGSVAELVQATLEWKALSERGR